MHNLAKNSGQYNSNTSIDNSYSISERGNISDLYAYNIKRQELQILEALVGVNVRGLNSMRNSNDPIDGLIEINLIISQLLAQNIEAQEINAIKSMLTKKESTISNYNGIAWLGVDIPMVAVNEKTQNMFPFVLSGGTLLTIFCQAINTSINEIIGFFILFSTLEVILFGISKLLKVEARPFKKIIGKYASYYGLFILCVMASLYLEMTIGAGFFEKKIYEFLTIAPFSMFIFHFIYDFFNSVGKINPVFRKPLDWVIGLGEKLLEKLKKIK